MIARLPCRTPRSVKEEADLARAEQNIGTGETRMTEQAMRVERLRLRGHDTVLAEALLATLGACLASCYAHRGEIIATINRLRSS